MKTVISTLLFALVLTTGLFAQQSVTNEKHERVLSHVEDNIFNVTFLDSNKDVVQQGQYWRDGDTYKPHGTWFLFAYGTDEIATTATYYKGKQLTVETIIDGKVIKANKELTAQLDSNIFIKL